jgi:hypothetical protein
MTPLHGHLEQALKRVGFGAMTPAEANAGPFARLSGETGYVWLEPFTYSVAFVTAPHDHTAILPMLEPLGPTVWGYDLNLRQHAASTERVKEFRFVVTTEIDQAGEELRWLGYRRQGAFWVRHDAACTVPALAPDHAGEIFPCLGWVPFPGATSAFDPAEQRPGFCSRTIPPGAESVPDVRGYHFIYGRYPVKRIARRRIIALLDPSRHDANVPTLVADALTLGYGEA